MLNDKMKSNKIIYSLNVNDIQTVAKKILYRKLSTDEIRSILDLISEKINWYEVISDSITEKFEMPAKAVD